MFKETIASLKATLGEDNAEGRQLLSRLEREVSGVTDDLREANSESKSRKLKIRELKAQIEDQPDVDSKIAGKDAEIERLSAYEQRWIKMEKTQARDNASKWSEFEKAFDVEETHPTFEKLGKLKDKFTFGDKLTPEQINKNLETYSLLDSVGAFKFEGKEGTDFDNDHAERSKGNNDDEDPYSVWD